MPLTTAITDNIKTLDPAAVTTRAMYGQQRRPWLPGYGLKTAASAAGKLYGVNHPGSLDNTKCVTVAGAAAANAGAAFAYTLPVGTGVALPTSANVSTAVVYANAWAIAYARGDRANAILLPRIAQGAADPTTNGAGHWRVDTASTLTLAKNYNGATYEDFPANWIVEIIVPASGEIVSMWQPGAAGTTIVPARDFVVSETAIFILNRIYC